MLTISNSGPYIPAADLDHILQPFQQARTNRSSKGDGHGLGLSIVAAIATAHDAVLTMRPHSDGGLHVEVSFPQQTRTPHESRNAAALNQP